MMNKRIFHYFCFGLALSSMFFYPLTASLNDSPFYMHWRAIHTYEFLLSWLGIAILLSFVLWFSFEKLSSRSGLSIIFAVSILPFISMGIHICRQIGLKKELIWLFQNRFSYGFILVIFLFTMVILVHPKMDSWRKKIQSLYTIALIVLSPLSLLSLYTVINFGFCEQPGIELLTDKPVFSSNPGKNTPTDNIYILLFDEMSYEYLYDNNLIREIYPNISAFASSSDNFHSADSPGGGTLSSIPALLLGKNKLEIKTVGNDIFSVNEQNELIPLRLYPDNLFSMATHKGYYTALFGWYLQYEKIVGNIADDCISFGMYNYSSLSEKFSILNPILTTIFTWPQNYPFGFFKKPMYAVFHKKNVENIFNLGFTALSRTEPSFIFLHFPIPHNPFVYDIGGFNPAFDPFLETDENYINQLKYVDWMVGKYLKEMKSRNKFDNSTIILMSDHNFRSKTEKDKWSRIPLIIKRKGQNKRRDFYESVAAVNLIKDLLVYPQR